MFTMVLISGSSHPARVFICVCGSRSAGGYSSVKSCDVFSIALHLATHRPSLIPDKFLNCFKMRAPRGGVAMQACQRTMRCVCVKMCACVRVCIWGAKSESLIKPAAAMETRAEGNSSSVPRDPSGLRPWYKHTHRHTIVYHRHGK